MGRCTGYWAPRCPWAGYLLKSYLLVQDLNQNHNAGYVLAIKQDDGTYSEMAGKGVLYETLGEKETGPAVRQD